MDCYIWIRRIEVSKSMLMIFVQIRGHDLGGKGEKTFSALRKCLRIRSVISVNYHYITVLCPFNLLNRFKCYNPV